MKKFVKFLELLKPKKTQYNGIESLLKPKNVLYDRIQSLSNFLDYFSCMNIEDDLIAHVDHESIEFKSTFGTRLLTIHGYDKIFYVKYYATTYNDYLTSLHPVNAIFDIEVSHSHITCYPVLSRHFGSKDIDLALWEIENHLYSEYGTPDYLKNQHKTEINKLMKGIYD